MPVDPEKVEKQEGVNWTLKPGVKNPIGERHRKYLEYQERAIRELCTQYGKIDIFWWDAAWWGGMFTADMWDAERITRLIRELQPGIILNNRCSVPGDFDTPEKRLGAFQNWRPWESCVCLTDTWSYSGTDVKSMKDMVEMLTATVCGDGNLLISWGARWSGAFAAAETERLKEFGVWVKAHELALFGTRGGPWKPGRWGGSVYRESTVYLHITHLSGDALELPALPDCTVLSARIFNTEHDVAVDASVNLVRLQIPAEIQADLDTIIELTLDTPAENIQAVESCKASPFADVYAYGHEVESDVSIRSSSVEGGGSGAEGDLPLRTNVESSPWIEFDLGSGLNVTGIALNLNDAAGNNADLHLYTSGDCGEWEDFGKLDAAENNVEITSYVAGAWIPGRTVRYVKVQSVSRQPTALDLLEFVCFAKGGKK
jgi:alpha-L-fucosidase